MHFFSAGSKPVSVTLEHPTAIFIALLTLTFAMSARSASLDAATDSSEPKVETRVASLPSEVPAKIRLLTAMSTPLSAGHAATVFAQSLDHKPMQFQSGQSYSKWSALFESALTISEVRVTACDSKDFEDGIEMYVDFNRARLYVDGGKPKLSFKWSGKARSITLGFLESKSICIDSVEIVSEQTLELPKVLAAVKTETQNEKTHRVDWKIGRDEKNQKDLVVDSIRVWNGDRMAGGNFVRKGRIKDFRVNGSDVVLGLKDQRFAQTTRLPAAVSKTDSLTLDILSTYQGVDSKEPVASEVQFLSGADIWVLPAEAASIGLSNGMGGGGSQLDYPKSAGIWSEVLDRELVTEGEDIWTFRFRSDGTFFARIFSEQYRTARSWSVLGRWEYDTDAETDLKEESRAAKATGGKTVSEKATLEKERRSILIRLIGSRTIGAGLWDSVPCGSTCFGDPFEKDSRGPASRADRMNELRIDERVELQRGPQNRYFLRSRSRIEKPGLEFRDLKLRGQSIYK